MQSAPGGPTALVLAGGGARGAYEAGALSVLLPALEQRGERPRILLGTSVGALNTMFLAANAHLPAAELTARALAIWESVGWREVVRPLLSTASLRRVAQYAGEVLRVPGAQIESLLDPAPLRATVRRWIDFRWVARNVRAGRLDAAGVVATSALTGRSVVFHAARAGVPEPPPDHRRGIDYVRTAPAEEHVLASAAIPVVFPAVHVDSPQAARGWYIDGGTRLNTPLKPALKLGAGRVVVVGLTPVSGGSARPASEDRPDLLGGAEEGRSDRLAGAEEGRPDRLAGAEEGRPDLLAGAGQVLVSLLSDQLAADLQTLATINRLVVAAPAAAAAAGKRRIPYIAVAPEGPGAVARRALEVVRAAGAAAGLRSPDLALLTRLLAGDEDVAHARLESFLLFAPAFARALIKLGQEDAQRWMRAPHDGGDLWQVSPLRLA